MQHNVVMYYDYTCPYSYRALLWLRRLQQAGRELDLVWKTLSLKEVNRHEGDPSIFERVQMESVSVLALELAKAAQATEVGVFEVTGGSWRRATCSRSRGMLGWTLDG